jgi:hypothetical protein
MSKYANPLEQVRVAAPCPAEWGRMVGDERMRYCDQCSLHVYNLSGMTKRAAEALVATTEGRLCVRFYQRADGTIITRNCPVGLSAVRRRVTRAATATLTAVLGFFAGLGLNFGAERALSPSVMEKSAVPAPLMSEKPPAGPFEPPSAGAVVPDKDRAELWPREVLGMRVRVGDGAVNPNKK